MKKYFTLLLCFAALTGCDFYIADNTRLVFSGTVLDQNGSPLPNVYTYVEGIDYVGGLIMSPANQRSEKLGFNHTDKSGVFKLVSLKSNINILHVNRENSVYLDYDEETKTVTPGPAYFESITTPSKYTSVDFVDLSKSQNFGPIKLRQKAELEFEIHKTDTSNDTLRWQLNYTRPYCYYVYEDGVLLEDKSSCYEDLPLENPPVLTPNNPYFIKTFQTIMGGKAIFTYSINNQPQQQVIINIDKKQVSYALSY